MVDVRKVTSSFTGACDSGGVTSTVSWPVAGYFQSVFDALYGSEILDPYKCVTTLTVDSKTRIGFLIPFSRRYIVQSSTLPPPMYSGSTANIPDIGALRLSVCETAIQIWRKNSLGVYTLQFDTYSGFFNRAVRNKAYVLGYSPISVANFSLYIGQGEPPQPTCMLTYDLFAGDFVTFSQEITLFPPTPGSTIKTDTRGSFLTAYLEEQSDI